jgi:hypothetical protein
MSLFSLYFIKKERKKSITPMTSFLMFFAKVPNAIVSYNHHHQSKHPINGNGSFLPLASN